MTRSEGEISGNARLHAIVEGRVQGVGFRYFVIETAQRLQLAGWVRNRWDDTVEVTAEGERSALDQLVGELHRGPRAARVTRVEVTWQTANGEFSRFSVLPTH
jgi:acylphosphatase